MRQDYPELVAACSAGNLETARFLQEHGSENKIYVRDLAALLEGLKAEEDARETALRLGRETDAEALCLPYGRGGLLAAVYLTALARRSGVELRLRAVPIRQETIALAEALGKNPYRMDTAGVLFLTAHSDSLVRALRAAGIPAACIGRLVPGLDKCVVDKTEREYINRPEKGITLEAEVFETERTKDA